MRSALAILLVAGCGDPVWNVTATVRSPDGAPMAGAALAITCPESERRTVVTWAELTDDGGRARLGGGAHLPAGCTVTVARPGYRTYTTTIEAMCAPKSIEDCYRARRIEVLLEPAD